MFSVVLKWIFEEACIPFIFIHTNFVLLFNLEYSSTLLNHISKSWQELLNYVDCRWCTEKPIGSIFVPRISYGHPFFFRNPSNSCWWISSISIFYTFVTLFLHRKHSSRPCWQYGFFWLPPAFYFYGLTALFLQSLSTQ